MVCFLGSSQLTLENLKVINSGLKENLNHFLNELNSLEIEFRNQEKMDKEKINDLISSLNRFFDNNRINKTIFEFTHENIHLIEDVRGEYRPNPDPFGTSRRNMQKYREKINEVKSAIDDALSLLQDQTFLSCIEKGEKIDISQLCEKVPIVICPFLYERTEIKSRIVLVIKAELLEEKDVQVTDLVKRSKLATIISKITSLPNVFGNKTKTEYDSNKWAVVDNGCLILTEKELLFFGEKRTIDAHGKVDLRNIRLVKVEKNGIIINRQGRERNEYYLMKYPELLLCLMEKLEKSREEYPVRFTAIDLEEIW